jgi:hypothetical protein
MPAYEDLAAWMAMTGKAITIALGESHTSNASYIARIDEFGLTSEGETLGEAITNLFADLETYVATRRAEHSTAHARDSQREPEDKRASSPDG